MWMTYKWHIVIVNLMTNEWHLDDIWSHVDDMLMIFRKHEDCIWLKIGRLVDYPDITWFTMIYSDLSCFTMIFPHLWMFYNCQHLVDRWMRYGQHVAENLMTCRLYVDDMWIKCGWHLNDMWVTCGWNVDDM